MRQDEYIVVEFNEEGEIHKTHGPMGTIIADMMLMHLAPAAQDRGGYVRKAKLNPVFLPGQP